MRSDLAHEEVEADIRAGNPPPGHPVAYDKTAARTPDKPSVIESMCECRPALPPPSLAVVTFEQAVAEQRLDEVLARVLEILDSVTSSRTRIDGVRITKIARSVQTEMASRNQGPASKRFVALIEAVVLGYPIADIAEHFKRRAELLDVPVHRDSRDSLIKELKLVRWVRLHALDTKNKDARK